MDKLIELFFMNIFGLISFITIFSCLKINYHEKILRQDER